MKEHPEANKQFGIRISPEIIELVTEIQTYHRSANLPFTLAAIVEDAIVCYYHRLIKEGKIQQQK